MSGFQEACVGTLFTKSRYAPAISQSVKYMQETFLLSSATHEIIYSNSTVMAATVNCMYEFLARMGYVHPMR